MNTSRLMKRTAAIFGVTSILFAVMVLLTWLTGRNNAVVLLCYLSGIAEAVACVGLLASIAQWFAGKKNPQAKSLFWVATIPAEIAIALPFVIIAVNDLVTPGWFSGLLAVLILLFVVPVFVIMLSVSIVMSIRERKKGDEVITLGYIHYHFNKRRNASKF